MSKVQIDLFMICTSLEPTAEGVLCVFNPLCTSFGTLASFRQFVLILCFMDAQVYVNFGWKGCTTFLKRRVAGKSIQGDLLSLFQSLFLCRMPAEVSLCVM